jgi:hypothetical protein
VEWIHVAQDMVQRWVLLGTGMNLLVCLFVCLCVCEVKNKSLLYEISNNEVVVCYHD